VTDFQVARLSQSQTEFGPHVAVQGPPADVWVDPTAVMIRTSCSTRAADRSRSMPVR
jgi:hypothetical protein